MRSSVSSNASIATVARSTVLFSGGARQGHSDGAAIGAKFAFPQGVTHANKLTWIADTSNHVIRVIDEYGATKTLAGSPGLQGFVDGKAGEARFDLPHSLCVDSKGNAIVTDHGQRVRYVTPEGVVTTLWDAATETDPKLRACSLRGVCCSADTIFLTCTASHAIIAIPLWAAVAAAASSSSSSSSSSSAAGAAAGSSSSSSSSSSAASIHHAKAHIIAGGNGPGYTNGKPLESQFNSPHGIDCNSEGHLFVGDTNNHCIRKVSRQVTTFAGSNERAHGLKDGSASKSLFYKPYGVCVDRHSDAAAATSASASAAGGGSAAVFVCDGQNKAIRRIAEGDVRTVAHLDFEPYDCAMDDDGNVIIDAPWIHQLHKLMLDDKGQLRGSLSDTASVASTNAGHGNGSLFGPSRDSTTQQVSSAIKEQLKGEKHNGGDGGAGGSAALETRITFNFGDAKSALTQAPLPGHRDDRELSIVSVAPSAAGGAPGSGSPGQSTVASTPKSGMSTRQPTADALGSPPSPISPTSPDAVAAERADDRASAAALAAAGTTSAVSPGSKDSTTTPGGSSGATAGNGKGGDGDGKDKDGKDKNSCRMCESGCAVM